MGRHPKLLEVVSLLLVVLVGANGCMTQGLWTERKYHPAARLDLHLAAAPDRPLILVGYREQFEKSQHIRRRSYWIDLTVPYEPFAKKTFVNPADFPGLIGVPLLGVTQGTNAIPVTGYAARETLDKPGFDLWKDGQAVGQFVLPAYEGDAPVTAETVAKTPVMLILDGVVIAAGVALVAALVYGMVVYHDENN